VEEARNTLAFTKSAWRRRGETVESAIDNANHLSSEKGLDVDLDNLYVKHAVANDGPRMKRIRPAPMGRAYHYVRRIAHLEIVLAEKNRNGAPVGNVGSGRRTAKALPQSRKRKPRRKCRRRRRRLARRQLPRNSKKKVSKLQGSEFSK